MVGDPGSNVLWPVVCHKPAVWPSRQTYIQNSYSYKECLLITKQVRTKIPKIWRYIDCISFQNIWKFSIGFMCVYSQGLHPISMKISSKYDGAGATMQDVPWNMRALVPDAGVSDMDKYLHSTVFCGMQLYMPDISASGAKDLVYAQCLLCFVWIWLNCYNQKHKETLNYMRNCPPR